MRKLNAISGYDFSWRQIPILWKTNKLNKEQDRAANIHKIWYSSILTQLIFQSKVG